MKRFLFFTLSLAIILVGLWYADTRLVPPSAPPPTLTPPPTQAELPAPTPLAARGPRVVVISLSGLGAGRLQASMEEGALPNLARLKAQGTMAQYALSIDPPLTLPAHAALATGAYPAATHVVGDRHQLPEDDFGRPAEARLAASMEAEPVWRTAMREARSTAALFWPGISLEEPAVLADYVVTQGVVDAGPAQHEVALSEAPSWPGAPLSFSPSREGTLTISKDGVPLARVHLLALDTSDDGQTRYDSFVLSRRREVSAASARLRPGEMAPLLIDGQVHSGAWFSVTEAGPDRVLIYQSAVCYNEAQPDELVRAINERFGFIPPEPDGEALRHGWITPELFVHMADIRLRWMASVMDLVLAEHHPELLFACLDGLDALERELLLVDPAQPGYSEERAAALASHLREGLIRADEAVGRIADTLDLESASLIVVSDHGVAPVHTAVYLNALLAAQKLLVHGAGPAPLVSQSRSQAIAVGSGGTAQVYLNLRRRNRAGIVAEEEYQKLLDRVVAILEGVRDAGGQPVFQRLIRREDLAALHLDAPTAGDLIVQAAPGYALSDELESGVVLGPAGRYGEAGYDAASPEMQGIFLAAGRGVRAAELGPVHILDLAPTVAHLLGLETPAEYSGRVLEEMLADEGAG
ncbi:MAG: alkaline phosphatase family protein [Anaerolineae bacterium]|nr:alkaline phosphatase family protein [Anaerolineae bacterium]